jgi:hypothetical protein
MLLIEVLKHILMSQGFFSAYLKPHFEVKLILKIDVNCNAKFHYYSSSDFALYSANMEIKLNNSVIHLKVSMRQN